MQMARFPIFPQTTYEHVGASSLIQLKLKRETTELITQQSLEMTSHQSFVTRPLPTGRNMYGRPIWESPILSYTSLIGEEYLKKRKAYLKYTFDDVAKTTSMMDVFTEYNLLGDYCRWTDSSARFARKEGGQEAMKVANFWEEMNEELLIDFEEVRRERERLKVHEYRHRDGRWEIVDFERTRGPGDVPWRDPVTAPGRDERSGGGMRVEVQEMSPDDPTLRSDATLGSADEAASSAKLPTLDIKAAPVVSEAEYPPSLDLFTFWS